MKLFREACGFAFATDFCFERLLTRGTDSLPRDVQMRFCSSPTLNTSPENYKDVGLRYLASFRWHSPNIPICCCSSRRCILLTDLAPLKMGLNTLSNCIRFVAKICNSQQILYPAHISLSSAFQAKYEWYWWGPDSFCGTSQTLCHTILSITSQTYFLYGCNWGEEVLWWPTRILSSLLSTSCCGGRYFWLALIKVGAPTLIAQSNPIRPVLRRSVLTRWDPTDQVSTSNNSPSLRYLRALEWNETEQNKSWPLWLLCQWISFNV